MMQDAVYDIGLNSFPRLTGEDADSARIQRAIDAAPSGVLYIPAGIYRIDRPIKITNLCSLLMHKSAVLRAEAEMNVILVYDANLQHNQQIRKPGMPEDYNLFIKGGCLDGNGRASCLMITEYHHFTLKDITLLNGRKYGLRTDDYGHGYEMIAINVYAKCTISGLGGNVAFSLKGGDSHYTDCVVVDYTIGFEDVSWAGANRFTRCHVWGGPLPALTEGGEREMLIDSICFKICAGGAVLRDCYADTAKIGFHIGAYTRLLGCSYFNNYRAFKLDDLVAIKHVGGKLLVSECAFTKTNPKAMVYASETTDPAVWSNNIYHGFAEGELPVAERNSSLI